MGHDVQLKLLTLIFALIAIMSISACAVASSPATSSDSARPDPTETPQPVEVSEPEPTATPAAQDDDQQSDDSVESEPAAADDDQAARDDDSGRVEASSDEPETSSPANPARLQIDSIDVDAEFEYVGVDDEGNMDVPQEWENVAWYEPGTVPGVAGNAVVAGHYDSDTGPAVFIDLNKLEAGDEVRIVTEDDEELIFEVTEIESVHVDDADTSKIFGKTDDTNLNLITCEGVWESSAGMYDHRLIVYTTLVS